MLKFGKATAPSIGRLIADIIGLIGSALAREACQRRPCLGCFV
jgi:hypothetical protein